MDLNKLAKKAKRIVDQRGGMESLKQDASELKDIAGKPGSLRDKAKAAAAALKDPGGMGEAADAASPAEPAAPAAGAPAPAEPAAPAGAPDPAEPSAGAGAGDQPS